MALSQYGTATADLAFNLAVVTPMVQMHQYSTWALCERITDDRLFNAWLVLCVSIIPEIIIMFFQKKIDNFVKSYNSQFAVSVWYRVYLYVLSVSNASHAWAVTILCELYFGIEITPALASAVAGLMALWALRCGRNITGNPYGLEVDSEPDFSSNTIFETSFDGTISNFFDTIFTVTVVYSQIHTHWFGVWTLLDRLVYPEDPWAAMVTCVGMGYLVTTVFLHLQHRAGQISGNMEKVSSTRKVMFEDIYFMVVTIFSVMLCKGLWMFFDLLLSWYPVYAGEQDVSLWAYHFTAFAVLTACKCSGSLVVRGVERDGKYSQGEGVKFSTSYFGGAVPVTGASEKESSDQNQNKPKED